MNPEFLRKYLVMGSQNCERDPLTILDEAIKGGITSFQYREKGEGALYGKGKSRLGHRLKERCLEGGILFIVNDDLELFEELEADGIHVGQSDLKVEHIRSKHPDVVIGLSVSNKEELAKSSVDHVDYLGVGPIFPTFTKNDANPVAGPGWVEEVKRIHPYLPVVGIGGITPDNAQAVIEAGADGVAVVSAIIQAYDVAKAVQSL